MLTLFLGILAVLQTCLIPGLLVLRLLAFNQGIVRTAITSFILSLLSNYLVVFLFVAIGIFNPWIVRSLFATECLFLAWLYRGCARQSLGELLSLVICQCRQFYHDYLQLPIITKLLAVVLAVAIVLYSHFGLLPGLPIFDAWDPLISYNVWAMEWFHGSLPRLTWHYPQLIPTSWAMIYCFIGDALPLQVFAKWIMGLFPIAALLMFFDLGACILCSQAKPLTPKASSRIHAYWLAGIIFALMLWQQAGPYIGSGYVDIPVMTVSMAPFYLLLTQRHYHFRLLVVVMLASAAAALTKQSGGYTLAVVMTFIFVIVMRQRDRSLGKLVGLLALTMVIVLPWYVFAQWQIFSGTSHSEVYFLTMMSAKSSWYCNLFQHVGFIYFIALILSLWFVLKPWSYSMGFVGVLLLMGVVYSAVWAVFFGYDPRNLDLALPFVSLGAALVLTQYTPLITTWISRQAQILLQLSLFSWLWIALLILWVVSTLPFYSAAVLLKKQQQAQKFLGRETWVNRMLYGYQQQFGFRGGIFTSWVVLSHLPKLSHYYQPKNYRLALEGLGEHPQLFLQKLKQSHARYYLSVDHPGLQSKAFGQDLKRWVQQKDFKPLVVIKGAALYQVRRIPKH